MCLVFVGTVGMPIIFLMKTNTANGLYSKHSQRESWRDLLLGPFPHLRPWPPTHHSEKRVRKSFFTYKCGSRSSVVGTLVKELGRRRNVGNAVNWSEHGFHLTFHPVRQFCRRCSQSSVFSITGCVNLIACLYETPEKPLQLTFTKKWINNNHKCDKSQARFG